MSKFFDVISRIQHVDQEVDATLVLLHGNAPADWRRKRDGHFQVPTPVPIAGRSNQQTAAPSLTNGSAGHPKPKVSSWASAYLTGTCAFAARVPLLGG